MNASVVSAEGLPLVMVKLNKEAEPGPMVDGVKLCVKVAAAADCAAQLKPKKKQAGKSPAA